MKSNVKAVIESFESGLISESQAFTKLKELTGRDVDSGWLKNYWRSESLDEFVDRLSAEPIKNCEQISDSEALNLIAEFLNTNSPGRRDRIEEALDCRFGKPHGTICELVFQGEQTEPERILDLLKADTRIYL